MLFGGTGLLVFVCFTACTRIRDEKWRQEVSKIGSAVSGFIILLLFFFLSFFPDGPTIAANNTMLTSYDEQVDFGLSHAKKGNFGRALEWFAEAKKAIRTGDPRHSSLDSLISQTKEKQEHDQSKAIQSFPAP